MTVKTVKAPRLVARAHYTARTGVIPGAAADFRVVLTRLAANRRARYGLARLGARSADWLQQAQIDALSGLRCENHVDASLKDASKNAGLWFDAGVARPHDRRLANAGAAGVTDRRTGHTESVSQAVNPPCLAARRTLYYALGQVENLGLKELAWHT